ncbi:core-binding factor subunit beta-like isoform X2 [Tubulanus polymorphus]
MNGSSVVSMLPDIGTTILGKVPRGFPLIMPRVVPDQRTKFENDEFFRKLSRESEIKYTGYRDRPLEERQLRLQTECREGHADVAFTNTGTNLQLYFYDSNVWGTDSSPIVPRENVDFDRESGKVHLRSRFIMNGVCVQWRGWIDLQRLDGTGCLEYDDERAQVEDSVLREQLEQYNRRLREFEDRQRQYRDEQER